MILEVLWEYTFPWLKGINGVSVLMTKVLY